MLYAPGFLGVCYDSGHGQTMKGGLDFLERVNDRLIALHLHDNDSKSDLHRLPFNGHVDWGRLTRLIAQSSYQGPMPLESTIHKTGFRDEKSYVRQACLKANALVKMIWTHREKMAEKVGT